MYSAELVLLLCSSTAHIRLLPVRREFFRCEIQLPHKPRRLHHPLRCERATNRGKPRGYTRDLRREARPAVGEGACARAKQAGCAVQV